MATKNALLTIGELPNFDAILPSQVAYAVDTVLAAGRAVAQQVADDDRPPNWNNIGAALEESEEKIASVWNQIEHLHAVVSTPEWRQAHRENLGKMAAYAGEMGQHEGLYKRICLLSQSSATLSATRQKIIADALRDFNFPA